MGGIFQLGLLNKEKGVVVFHVVVNRYSANLVYLAFP